MINVTVWNEYRHEKESEKIASIYPSGIHETIKSFLSDDDQLNVVTATLDEKEHGLSDERLQNTDVLIWWGHKAHGEVRDDIVDKVADRVRGGMGLIVLHSGHFSKIFKKLMGTSCSLKWREASEKCRVWNIQPTHPITKDIGEYIELENEEMYGEPFGIPTPDELIVISWFKGGEVFRSGGVFNKERGKVFYFQPGHETYPIYHNEKIQRVIQNACHYVAPNVEIVDTSSCQWIKTAIEEL